MDARADTTHRRKGLVHYVIWPFRSVSRGIARLFRRHGPVKATTFLVGGVCAFLLFFNLVVGPLLLSVMIAHMPKPTVSVAAAQVNAITWMPGLEAVGTAKASEGADIVTQADGVVATIDVTPQTKVTKAQRLIQIDDAVEQADLIAAEANVRLGEAAMGRTATLTRKGVSAQSQLDDARNQLDVARSSLARTRALIDYKAVKAPFDGTVGIPRVEIGQYVTKGTVLITLQNLDHIHVDFTLPEQSASRVVMGQTVGFGASSDTLTLRGHVTGIDPKADPDTKLVNVRADIDDTQGKVLPGQFLSVRIDLPSEPNVLALPGTAVMSSLFGDYVYVLEPTAKDGKASDAKPGDETYVARQIIVKTGRRTGDRIEILDGLKPGQWVVANGQNAVQGGGTVKIAEKVGAPGLAPREAKK